jgi:hypothetical protein
MQEVFLSVDLWYNNRKDGGYYTNSSALFLAAEAATEKEGYYTSLKGPPGGDGQLYHK